MTLCWARTGSALTFLPISPRLLFGSIRLLPLVSPFHKAAMTLGVGRLARKDSCGSVLLSCSACPLGREAVAPPASVPARLRHLAAGGRTASKPAASPPPSRGPPRGSAKYLARPWGRINTTHMVSLYSASRGAAVPEERGDQARRAIRRYSVFSSAGTAYPPGAWAGKHAPLVGRRGLRMATTDMCRCGDNCI